MNAIEIDLKYEKDAVGNSMYHFIAILLRVRWKILNRMLSSLKEFHEHHK